MVLLEVTDDVDPDPFVGEKIIADAEDKRGAHGRDYPG
jgi:hypothetical protein